jgi:hypothetical protein
MCLNSHHKKSRRFKRLTWLKCPHWPKGMSILIKILGHEKHMLRLTNTFDKSDFFYQMSIWRFGQNGQLSIKMAMV